MSIALSVAGASYAQSSGAVTSPSAASQPATPPVGVLNPSAPATPAPATNTGTSGTGVPEIVVTAQRRSEALSKVPVAITALNAASLSKNTVIRETDLQSLVPGLTVKATGSQNQLNYSIRGQTLDAFSGSSPGVLVYVNDVQVSSQTATSLYDLSSVQVLKGPQGTLFGRNATGGAVLYSTAQPGNSYGGFLTFRAGDYSMHQVQGAVDLPIIQDKLLVRIAGDFNQEDGYVRNLTDGRTLGDTDAKSIRATVKWMPTSDFTNSLVVQYGKYGGTNLTGLLQSVNPVGSNYQGSPLNTTGALIYGQALSDYVGIQKARGPYVAQLDYKTPSFDANTFYSEDTATYTISPDLQFRNIVSFNRSRTNTQEILSGSPFGVIDLVQPNGNPTFFGITQWSEEAQVLGKTLGEKLKYIVGVYGASEDDHDLVPVTVGFGLPTPAAAFNYNYNNQDNSRAVYFQGTYDLSDLSHLQGLSVTGGFRYTWEGLHLTQTRASLFEGAPTQAMKESDPSWQLGVQWQIDPTLLLYFVNRGSWRAGNFNGTTDPTGNQNAFYAETTYDFEVGSKFNGRFLDKRTSLNVDFYHQVIFGVQRDVYFNINGNPASFTHNVPQAVVEGAEADGSVQLLSWLTLGANVAFTDARYTKPDVNLFGQNIVFGDYQDTPRWSGTISADVTLPTPSRWGVMTLHADAYSQTHTYYSSLAFSLDPGTSLNGYGLVSARYDWKNIFGSKISAAVYGKNLTDSQYYIGGYALGADVGINTHIPGSPRQVGGELSLAF